MVYNDIGFKNIKEEITDASKLNYI